MDKMRTFIDGIWKTEDAVAKKDKPVDADIGANVLSNLYNLIKKGQGKFTEEMLNEEIKGKNIEPEDYRKLIEYLTFIEQNPTGSGFR